MIVRKRYSTPIFKALPVDTGRKLNVHKTFRRRPGRLLNVLCTLNLRPVSTGLKLRQCLQYSLRYTIHLFIFYLVWYIYTLRVHYFV